MSSYLEPAIIHSTSKKPTEMFGSIEPICLWEQLPMLNKTDSMHYL